MAVFEDEMNMYFVDIARGCVRYEDLEEKVLPMMRDMHAKGRIEGKALYVNGSFRTEIYMQLLNSSKKVPQPWSDAFRVQYVTDIGAADFTVYQKPSTGSYVLN